MPPDEHSSELPRSGRGSAFFLTLYVGLIILTAAFLFGKPFPIEKANALTILWGTLAAASFIGLALSRAFYPWGSLLAAVSIHSALHAAFGVFVRETASFHGWVGYYSEFRIIAEDVGRAESDFMVGALPAALLAVCWALTLELWFPRRGAAMTAILILSGVTILGVIVFT